MHRSLARATGFTATAIACVALAACAPTSLGPILVAPATAAPAISVNGWDLIAAVEQSINSELAAVSASPSTDEAQPIELELNALNNDASLILAEQFTSIQAVGARQASKREQVVSSLLGDVDSNAYVGGAMIAGETLKQRLVSFLDGVNAQLTALSSKIASDQLIDVLRSDVISVAASTRVYGLVEPMVHLSLAAGDEMYALNRIASQAAQLQSRVAALSPSNPAAAAARSHLQDLDTALNDARTAVTADVQAVLALTPSGFPGNRSIIQQARASLVQIRSPLGYLGVAAGDVSEIIAVLGDGN
jgi:hypothetical protein